MTTTAAPLPAPLRAGIRQAVDVGNYRIDNAETTLVWLALPCLCVCGQAHCFFTLHHGPEGTTVSCMDCGG